MASGSRSAQIESFERISRQHGLPVTMQRRTVFEILSGRKDHPTADQVYDEARPRLAGISRTTVYRILDAFVQHGLVKKICHPGPAVRFDPKVRRHDHLVCMHCEKVIDIEDSGLADLPWPDVRGHGFEIRDYHVHFLGVCAECRKRKKGGGGSRKPSRRDAGSPAARPERETVKKRR